MSARTNARRLGRISFVGLVAVAPLAFSGTASAAPAPNHVGNPAVWGPAVETLCDSPAQAAALGYNVLVLNNNPNTFTGSPGPDAIYARGGNDTIRGGGGDDVICLGLGNDQGRGDSGFDAVFGEGHNDTTAGDSGRDFLDGGTQTDTAFGGTDADAGDDNETEFSIP